MKKLLIHHNGGDPIYIGMCNAFYFYVIHRGKTVSKHELHWDAIASATKECIDNASDEISGDTLGWQPIPQFSLA